MDTMEYKRDPELYREEKKYLVPKKSSESAMKNICESIEFNACSNTIFDAKIFVSSQGLTFVSLTIRN